MESSQASLSAPPERFETARLRLRRPTLDDARDVFAYASDPEVTRYLSFTTHRVIETVQEFLRGLDAALQAGNRYAWGITLAESDRLIGMAEIRIDGARVEMGYVLARPYWGQGYMAEALEPIVRWAMRQERIHRVGAFCDAENRSSARVMEKLGMKFEGILRKWAPSPNIAGEPRDCRFYSLVRE